MLKKGNQAHCSWKYYFSHYKKTMRLLILVTLSILLLSTYILREIKLVCKEVPALTHIL